MKKDKTMNSYHVGIAAEAIVASLFARCGYDVSIQYGANQPEYDLVVIKGESIIKVSVKGSQDGGWGLTQSYLTKGKADYHAAIDKWLANHGKNTIMALVQFEKIAIPDMPEVYLATPNQIAEKLKAARSGKGDTILYKYHKWTGKSFAKGTEEKIPESWKFSEELVQRIFADCI